MNFKIVRSKFSIYAVGFGIGLLLTACGSKPEASDIAPYVESTFRCSPFTVTEVKKINGAPAGDNQYAVAYSFHLEVKGGKQGAIDLVTNLLKNRVAYEQAIELKNSLPFDQRGPYEAKVVQLRDQLHQLSWGGCKEQEIDQINIEIPSLLERMQVSALKGIQSNPAAVAIAYVMIYEGKATMLKTEKGWVVGDDARNDLVDALATEPFRFERPAAPPVVAPQGTAPNIPGANG